jgi:hypothetical protein
VSVRDTPRGSATETATPRALDIHKRERCRTGRIAKTSSDDEKYTRGITQALLNAQGLETAPAAVKKEFDTQARAERTCGGGGEDVHRKG